MARTKPEHKNRRKGEAHEKALTREGTSGRAPDVSDSLPAQPVPDDDQWEATTARYADKLTALADKVRADRAAARTTPPAR